MTTATEVGERPILFSAPMVRAILAGTKTQTRRIVKPQPVERRDVDDPTGITRNGWWWTLPNGCGIHSAPTAADCMAKLARSLYFCKYGQPGKRLWVRETVWRAELEGMGVGRGFLVYDDEWRPDDFGVKQPAPAICRQWTASNRWGRVPSIHMPRWACRIVLEITDVRVERLQAITEAGAIAEGVERMPGGWACPLLDTGIGVVVAEARTAYHGLWNSINGAGSWDANPWVWALTFKRVTP